MPNEPLPSAVLAALLEASAQALVAEATALGPLARVRPGLDATRAFVWRGMGTARRFTDPDA